MLNGGTPPDFKVSHYFDQYTRHSTSSVEEKQTREGGHGQGAVSTPLDICSNEEMANTPGQAGFLIRRHALMYLLAGGSWQRCGQLQGCPGRRLWDHSSTDVDTTALVGVTASLSRGFLMHG